MDKKESNNQLVCVLEYTWQNAVTKYQKNKINTISIIKRIINLILYFLNIFNISEYISFFVSYLILYPFLCFIFSSSFLKTFLIEFDELLNFVINVIKKYDNNVE